MQRKITSSAGSPWRSVWHAVLVRALPVYVSQKEKDAHSNVKNKRICKEGPVFRAEEVEF